MADHFVQLENSLNSFEYLTTIFNVNESEMIESNYKDANNFEFLWDVKISYKQSGYGHSQSK